MNSTILIIDARSTIGDCLRDFLSESMEDMQVLSVRRAEHAAGLGFLPVTCCLVSNSRDLPIVRETFPAASLLLVCEGQGAETSALQPMDSVFLDMPRYVFLEVVRSAAQRGHSGALGAAPAVAGHQRVSSAEMPTDGAPQSVHLSDREGEVLAALKRGLPNKLIADELQLSENTVKIHVRNLMRKLGVTNRTMAALHQTTAIVDEARPDLRG